MAQGQAKASLIGLTEKSFAVDLDENDPADPDDSFAAGGFGLENQSSSLDPGQRGGRGDRCSDVGAL